MDSKYIKYVSELPVIDGALYAIDIDDTILVLTNGINIVRNEPDVDFVNKLTQIAKVIYLTARPLESYQQTLQELEGAGFPVKDCDLVCHDNRYDVEDEFHKGRMLLYYLTSKSLKFERIIFADDKRYNLSDVKSMFPKAETYLVLPVIKRHSIDDILEQEFCLAAAKKRFAVSHDAFFEEDDDDFQNNLYPAVVSGNWTKIVNALFTNKLECDVVDQFYHENALQKLSPNEEDIYIPYAYLWQQGKTNCGVIGCSCSGPTTIFKLFTTCDRQTITDLIDCRLISDADITNEDIKDIFFCLPIEKRYEFLCFLFYLLSFTRFSQLTFFFTSFINKNGIRTFRVKKEYFKEEHWNMLFIKLKTKYLFDVTEPPSITLTLE